MRSLTWLLIAGSLTAPYTAAMAIEPPPANVRKAAPHHPAAKPTVGPTEVTEAYGDVPQSLAGTWLVVASGKVTERYLNGWHAYRITHQGATWQVNELRGPPTALLEKELDAANAQGAAYTPSAAVLAATKDLLPTLKQPPVGFRAVKIALRTPDHFIKGNTDDPRLEWAKLVIELTGQGENIVASGQTYYVKDITADRLAGDVVTVNLIAAYGGTLVPIHVEGPFTMFRIK